MTEEPAEKSIEVVDTAPAEEAAGEGTQAAEAGAALLDPLASLQAELAVAKAESKEWYDRFLRKAAELENYRKRIGREQGELVARAKSTVLLEFLPVVDACERALASLADAQGKTAGIEQYRSGVQLLYKQVLDTLACLGVVPIEAEGKKFDPQLHEAMTREETSECAENVVMRELRRGYLFGDRLLRPAQVSVSTRPQGNNSPKI